MSAHPLDKYFNNENDSNSEGSDLDYEKSSAHPLDKYFKEEPGFIQKGASMAARVPLQFGLGVAESVALPYELGVAGVRGLINSGKDSLKQQAQEDYQKLLEKKKKGTLSAIETATFDRVKHLAEEELKDFPDISIRGIAQKAANPLGINLEPQNIAEKAAGWAGILKNPAKISALFKSGIGVKDIIKNIAPTAKEALSGLGAGTALQIAEDGGFGPIGTLAAGIAGHLIGHGVHGLGNIKGSVFNLKKMAQKGASALVPKEKLDIQKQLINDFRSKGIQADIGTITDSNAIKMLQARAAASGLTGAPLQEFKQKMTKDFLDQYRGIADQLGSARFQNLHEAGDVSKNLIKELRDADLIKIRGEYGDVRNLAHGKTLTFESSELAKKVKQLETQLEPGSIKSPETQKVINEIQNLKKDLFDAQGNLKPMGVDAALNNKINLNDIIDYDLQGGAKQLLKGVVKDIDTALKDYGRTQDKNFLKKYESANKKAQTHAQTFRNKNISQVLKTHDPRSLMNKMNTTQGILDIKKALSKSAEGKETFDNLARLKLDQIVGENMIDGITGQLKNGQFSNLLTKGNNREIIKELLDPKAFQSLEHLQKLSGKLADTANKFLNTSQSGTTGLDAKTISTLVHALGALPSIFTGNLWPLIPYGGILAVRKATRWIADPTFLKGVEDMILATQHNNPSTIRKAAQKMLQGIETASRAIPETQDHLQETPSL